MSDTTVISDSSVTAAAGEQVGTDLAQYTGEDVVTGAVEALSTGNALAYSSITGSDFGTKIRLLQAVTNSEAFGDNINRKIGLLNIVVQVIDLADPQTGELTKQPRIILIDTEGNAFHAISGSLLLSLRNIIGMAGQPETWESPIEVKFTKNKAKVGSFYSLDILGAYKIEAPAAKK